MGCKSEFGPRRDMHGGVWEWTDSPWGRGSERPLISVRGGNAPQGELVGRCARERHRALGRVPRCQRRLPVAVPGRERGRGGASVSRGDKLDAKLVPDK